MLCTHVHYVANATPVSTVFEPCCGKCAVTVLGAAQTARLNAASGCVSVRHYRRHCAVDRRPPYPLAVAAASPLHIRAVFSLTCCGKNTAEQSPSYQRVLTQHRAARCRAGAAVARRSPQLAAPDDDRLTLGAQARGYSRAVGSISNLEQLQRAGKSVLSHASLSRDQTCQGVSLWVVAKPPQSVIVAQAARVEHDQPCEVIAMRRPPASASARGIWSTKAITG